MDAPSTTPAPGSDTPRPDPSAETTSPRSPRFPPAARWTLVFVVVMLALIVAIWPRGGSDPSSGTGIAPPSGVPAVPSAQVGDEQLAQARAAAAIEPCPQTGLPEVAAAALRGVVAPCLATGAPYDLGVGTAGKPLVVNMWAVWCLPCRRELPVLADYARRAGDKVTVLTVHDRQGAANPYLVLQFLQEVGVHLPVVLDVDGAVAAALRAPRVYPSTILIRPDGSVAAVEPRVFDDPDEVAATVREHLGVTT
ncbi:TlpA family protein disulfide reductase [Gordonia sp. NPDC003425]